MVALKKWFPRLEFWTFQMLVKSYMEISRVNRVVYVNFILFLFNYRSREGRIWCPDWLSGQDQIQVFKFKIMKSGRVRIQIFQCKSMRSGLVQIQLFPCEIDKCGHVQSEIFIKWIWISGHVQIHHFAIEIRRSGLNQSLMLASLYLYFVIGN